VKENHLVPESEEVDGRGQVGHLAVDVAVNDRLVRRDPEIAQPEEQNSGRVSRSGYQEYS